MQVSVNAPMETHSSNASLTDSFNGTGPLNGSWHASFNEILNTSFNERLNASLSEHFKKSLNESLTESLDESFNAG
jgi:hypothetical protein